MKKISQPTIIAKDLKPAEILCLDDDEWFLRLLVKKFQSVDPNFKITTAMSVEEALGYIQEQTFDCILCDHKLPGTISIHGKIFPSDGIHVMRKFKDELEIDSPFIFVTGQGSEEIASQALQLGAAGYFIKRVQPGYYSLMATSIRQIIDRYWLRRELKESEFRYKDLFENATGLILIFDTEGNLQESNQNFYTMFGYKTGEDLTYSQIAYSDDFEKWQSMIEFITQGNNQIQLLRAITADNSVLHLDIHARPIWDQRRKEITGIQAIARDISDQVKTQQALIDSEEKHRKIVEGSIDAIIFVDIQGEVIDWNPAATLITGIDPKDAVGKKIEEILQSLKPSQVNDPESIEVDPSVIRREYERLFESEFALQTPKMIEFSLENIKTGKRHIIETVGFIVEHSKGNRVAIVMRDVTERRVAEAESRSFAQRFQILIEQTAIGVWVTDLTETTTYVNESVAQILGYSKREIIGASVLDFATPESAEIIRIKTKSRFTRASVNDTYELQFFHRNGKLITTLVTAAAIYDESGNLQETYGLIRDVTAEREREEELKRTKEYLESVIASMPSGVYSYDLDQKISMANPRLAEILRYTSKNELIGKSIFDLFPSREHARVRKYVKERMTGQPSKEYIPINYLTRQGKEVITSITSIPLIIDGKVEGAVVTVSDLTEQRQIEEYVHKISHEYRVLLEKLPGGVLKINNLGQVITYTEKAVDLLKFTDITDLGTLNILEYHPFKEAGITDKFRNLLYQKTEEEIIKVELTDDTGKTHSLNFHIFPVKDQFMENLSWFVVIEETN
ncbi:MAG: PAS domain S-box protein [Candidatus Hodarchaeales archaeon]